MHISYPEKNGNKHRQKLTSAVITFKSVLNNIQREGSARVLNLDLKKNRIDYQPSEAYKACKNNKKENNYGQMQR